MAKKWQELSVLIVGCGSIGKRHARVLQNLGVQDIRACDPIPIAREKMLVQMPSVKMYESYEEGLIDSPDTVLICTPPEMHIPMAIQAINAGCHVLCEKPLSDTTDGVDDLLVLSAKKDKKVMVGLCFRYHDGIIKAKNYLKSGCFGRLVSVRTIMGEHLPDVRPDYRDLYVSKHNGAFDLIHDIDLALWFADKPIRNVKCIYGNYSDIGIDAPDLVEILIDFEDRCMASIHLDFFQRPRRRQLELICTGGVIIVEFAQWERCRISVYEIEKGDWKHEELKTERDDMFRTEDKEFLIFVAEDLPIVLTVTEACKSLEVVMAAHRTGCIVTAEEHNIIKE